MNQIYTSKLVIWLLYSIILAGTSERLIYQW